MDSLQYPHMVFCLGKTPNMDIAKVISANIAGLMATHPGLDTIKKIASRSGVGFGTVQRARNGDGNITIEKLTAIANAFGRHPAELLIEQPTLPVLESNGEYSRTIEGTCQRIQDAAAEQRANIIPLPDSRLKELLGIAERIDDQALAYLIGYAQRLAEENTKAARKGNGAR